MSSVKNLVLALCVASCCVQFGCQSILGIESLTVAEDVDNEDSGTPPDGGDGTGGQPDSNVPVGKPALCQEYCERMLELCATDMLNAPAFMAQASCEEYCQMYPLGEEEDRSGNTLYCRLNEIRDGSFADEGSIATCKNAGPSGGGRCGDPCSNYCQLNEEICGSGIDFDNLANGLLKDKDAAARVELCESQCPALLNRQLDAEGKPEGAGNTDSTYHVTVHDDEDSLQCRLIQLETAVSDRKWCFATNIYPHLRYEPDEGEPNPCLEGVKADRCDDYCRVVSLACSGETQVYDNVDQCRAACDALPAPRDGSGGNTVACRLQHAYNSLVLSPTTHCPHAGPGGAGVCGSDCEGYCSLLATGCAGEFESAFAEGGQSECVARCELEIEQLDHHVTPFTADTAIESGGIHCTVYEAVQAAIAQRGGAADEANRSRHCEAALGGGVCAP